MSTLMDRAPKEAPKMQVNGAAQYSHGTSNTTSKMTSKIIAETSSKWRRKKALQMKDGLNMKCLFEGSFLNS